MSINLEEIVERAVPTSQGLYRVVRTEDFDALVAEVERLREEVHTMRRWAEEAAHAENLNALDAQKERASVESLQREIENENIAQSYDMGRDLERASVLALLDRELEIAEAHDLLMGTLRVRQMRDIIERGEHRREEER